jgi:enoyl-CoA hydratase/carnithine racemase
MSLTFETLLYEEGDGIATVTLNRAEVYNAFNTKMRQELRSLWRYLRHHDPVRAIVLTAAGEKAFCTGVDRQEIIEGAPPPVATLEADDRIGFGTTPFHYDDPGDDLGPKACDLWKPVIAAVNGMACGGAFYLLGEVDFIVAADNATFFDPHVTYGMTTAFEAMLMLQRMPLGEVMRMSLMGNFERITAGRAMEVGLVSEVVPRADLVAHTQEIARQIATAPTLALQGTVRSIWTAQELSRQQALSMGSLLVAQGTDDESLAEGQQTFRSGARIEPRLR